MAKRSNGEGSVRENSERGRWEGRVSTGVDHLGRPVRRMVTGRTKAAVLQRMREMAAAADAGLDPAPRTLTVGRFLDRWAADELPGSVAPRTEQQYLDTVRLYLKPTIGQKRLRSLQASDVTKMLRTLATTGVPPNNQPLSPNTCRIVRAVLRRALRHAEVEGLVTRNVAALARGVKLDRPSGRSLSPAQARQLLEAVAGDRLEAAYTVALALGLRAGELLALTWGDLDLDGKPARMAVNAGVTRIRGEGLIRSATKTHGSKRVLHMPPQVVEALRRHRRRQTEERLALGSDWQAKPLGVDLVFRSELGTALDPDNLRRHVYRTTRETFTPRAEWPKRDEAWPPGAQWSPHELRHSAASLLIAQAVPIEVVSETLGHSSIKVTADVYSHLFDGSKARAADAMAEALWGND